MLFQYGILQYTMLLSYDNMSAINIAKNLIQHSRIKHIDIQYHFIWELVEKKDIGLKHVCSPMQLVHILIKPLDFVMFESLRPGLGVCRYNP